MRQLVSIVNDGSVRYYLADGGDLEEVARVRVGDKFSPEQAVLLGINLVDAIGKPAVSRAAPAPAPAPIEVEAVKPAPKPKPKAERISWKNVLSYEMVLDVLTVAGPDGLLGNDVAERLGFSSDVKGRKAVANRLRGLKDKGVVTTRRDPGAVRNELIWSLKAAVPSPVSVAAPIGSPVHSHENGVLV